MYVLSPSLTIAVSKIGAILHTPTKIFSLKIKFQLRGKTIAMYIFKV